MPSIGKDLVKIRTHLGLTIQDIQYATKIPVHTLNKVEDDSIFDQSEEGTIYIRSFVRSYGRALNIEEALMIEALDQYESGSYQNLLLKRYLNSGSDAETPLIEDGQPDDQSPANETQETDSKPEESTPSLFEEENADEEDSALASQSGTAGSDTAQNTMDEHAARNVNRESRSANVDWAKMGHRISQDKRPVSLWIIGLIILVIVLGIVGYFIVESDYFSGSDPAQEEITTPADEANGVSMNFADPANRNFAVLNGGEEIVLNETLYITIFAAYGNADPVRVWSDLKPRPDPYWLNTGTAMNFEFRDEIRIRGPFDNMLLFMNGNLIENPTNHFFNEETNDVELSRDYFASSTVWSDSVALRLPEGVAEPDTITNRSLF